MCVKVVNVRGLNRPDQRAGVCYVGRAFAGWPGSPWGNPFRPRAEGFTVAACLDRFRAFAETAPPEYLADLWEACGRGAKPLGCWCVEATAGDGSPVVCHGQVLAEMLSERFGAK
jgi:hypothetical protein